MEIFKRFKAFRPNTLKSLGTLFISIPCGFGGSDLRPEHSYAISQANSSQSVHIYRLCFDYMWPSWGFTFNLRSWLSKSSCGWINIWVFCHNSQPFAWCLKGQCWRRPLRWPWSRSLTWWCSSERDAGRSDPRWLPRSDHQRRWTVLGKRVTTTGYATNSAKLHLS